jgi:hypothetical protein
LKLISNHQIGWLVQDHLCLCAKLCQHHSASFNHRPDHPVQKCAT